MFKDQFNNKLYFSLFANSRIKFEFFLCLKDEFRVKVYGDYLNHNYRVACSFH